MWNTTLSVKHSAMAPLPDHHGVREPANHLLVRMWHRSEGDARDDHDAGLGHLLHRVLQALASEARLLRPAVGHLVGTEGRYVVDDDAADLDLAVGQERPLQVAREHPGLEAEGRPVHAVDGLLEGLVAADRGDRSEDLLPAHLHVVADA